MLRPHPKAPTAISSSACTMALCCVMLLRLKRFDLADVMENPRFQSNLETWIGRPVEYPRFNETTPVPGRVQIGSAR
jgi:hypothetical protein